MKHQMLRRSLHIQNYYHLSVIILLGLLCGWCSYAKDAGENESTEDVVFML
jgi:hypothetical protein